MPRAAADWYDDPGESGDERWWDGNAWTTHRRPKTAPANGTAPAPEAGAAARPTASTNDSDSNASRPINWYPDPDVSGHQRWWDGDQWTNHRRPAPQSSSVASSAHRLGISTQNLTVIGVVVVLSAVVIAAIALSSDSDQDVAQDRCKDSVLDQLATPATTKFLDDVRVMPSGLDGLELVDVSLNAPGVDTDRITTVWEVSGSFDTENRNGAMVRGTYACKAAFAGDEFVATVTSADIR